MNWYITALKKYAVFKGRSRRKEYWMFTLFQIIFGLVATAIDYAIGSRIDRLNYGIVYSLYSLATFIPGMAVTVRRLHDIGKSGWWLVGLFFLVIVAAVMVATATLGSGANAIYAPIIVGLIFIAVAIVWLVFMCTDSQPGANKWGPNPKTESAGFSNEALDSHMAR